MKYLINILIILASVINLYSIQLQKATIYNENMKINNWYMSEKLDGIRAYWDGEKLLSKNGNIIHAPIWFIKDLPSF
jgi:DNA ligase-1